MDRMAVARLTGLVEVALTVTLVAVVVWQFLAYAQGGASPPFAWVLLAGGLVWLVAGLRNWLLPGEVAEIAQGGGSRGLQLGGMLGGRRDPQPDVLGRTGVLTAALGLVWVAIGVFLML